MVERETQIITSKYGPRGTGFHRGVDLRTREEKTYKKQNIIAPEQIKIVRVVYQEKWGYTIVASALDSGGQLKFTHVLPVKGCIEGTIYLPGEVIALPDTTEYMIKNKYYEHLHFERWEKGQSVDPIIYFDQMEIKYEYL